MIGRNQDGREPSTKADEQEAGSPADELELRNVRGGTARRGAGDGTDRPDDEIARSEMTTSATSSRLRWMVKIRSAM